jgi:hypothetical protein
MDPGYNRGGSILEQNGRRKYLCLVIRHSKKIFCLKHFDSIHMYSEVDITKMWKFIVNIFVVFGNQTFQQSVEILRGTNWALLLVLLF